MEKTKPCRVQRKRTKGFNMQAASPNGLPVVYVGRPSKWGNPDGVEHEGILGYSSLFWFKLYAVNVLKTDPHWLDELRGKNLACWCSLDANCHADILLKLCA